VIASPTSRSTGTARIALALLALAACLALSLAAAGPAAAQEGPDDANAPAAPGGKIAPGKSPGEAADNLGEEGGGDGGGGAGWSPLISALQSLVPVAGAIGLLIGLGIWGSAGANSAQKQVGLGVMGTACLGLVIGSFAADLAAMFTQWI
jgi:hypothetical protein